MLEAADQPRARGLESPVSRQSRRTTQSLRFSWRPPTISVDDCLSRLDRTNGLGEFRAPSLGRHLDRIPWAAERRGVAKIEIVEIVDARALKYRGSDDVDPLRYLCFPIAEDLTAQQPASSAIPCQADSKRHRAGVISFMVVGFETCRYRVEPCLPCVSLAKAGARDRQVEHLQALRSQRAREYPIAANRILAGDPPLFVRDRSQRDIGRRGKQAVIGLDAITRRKNLRHVRAHLPRNDNGALNAELRSGLFREFAVGASADRENNEIRCVLGARRVRDGQPRWATNFGSINLHSTDASSNANAMSSQLFLDQVAEGGVDCGQHGLCPAEQGHLNAALGESIGHLKAYVPSAD